MKKPKTSSTKLPKETSAGFEELIRKVGERAMARMEEEVKESSSIEELVRGSEQAAKELNAKISLGLLGKRKTESWEEFEDPAVQMFRDKRLFKSEDDK